MAATATRNTVSAVASLNRLSPTSTVITRRGSPRRRPMDTAATASGGATTAASASAAGSGRPGTSHQATSPTHAMVNSTSPTASSAIGRMFALIWTAELASAAE